MEVFWGSGSPYSWRVLLTLEVKHLAYESHLISFSKQENHAPSFLGMNPRGKVPVLKDGPVILYESLAIMAYLEKKHPEPALFGKTPLESGMIQRSISEYTAYVDPAVESFINPIYFGGAEEKVELLRAARTTVVAEIERLQSGLGDRPYLVGETLSAADLVWYPAFQSLKRASSKDVAKKLGVGIALDAPPLAAWQKRIEALPGYDRTYPPHWKN